MTARLFSILLRLLPRGFRAEYGEDMRVALGLRTADARARGVMHCAWFVLRESAGIIRAGIVLRLPIPTHANGDPARTRVGSMEYGGRELRYAGRRLLHTPGFATACVTTLALAIGANLTIFAIVHRVVLAPLPYPESGRLLALDHAAPGVGLSSGLGMSTGLYREYGALPLVEAISLYGSGEATITGFGDAERMPFLEATPSLGDVLRVRPALGRWFSEAEGAPDASHVVILSHDFWVTRLGSNRNVIGRSVTIDGTVHEVIGIMPRDFGFPDHRAQLIMPMRLDLTAATAAGFNFRGIARTTAGVDATAARTAFDAVIADLPQRFPEQPDITIALTGEVGLASLAQPQKSYVLGNTAQTLWVVMGAVAVVLLIACVNLANLFMARADARQREVAIRKALGATRMEIGSLFLTESLVIVGVSAAIGLLLASAAVRALVVTAPIPLPRLAELHIGMIEAGFLAVIALIAAVCFGIVPLAARRPSVAAVLQDAGRGSSASAGRMRARHMLMATQVALAVMLLVAAGLMTQSFLHIRDIDPGFRADSRLIFRIGLPAARYESREQQVRFHEQMLERIRALPGVQGAALTTLLPLEGDGNGDPLDVEGRETAPGALNPVVRYRLVSPDYYDVMRIRLVSGRLLAASDADGRSNAIVIDEALAALYFNGQDAVGRRVRPMKQPGDWLNIVGVVANTSTFSMSEPIPVAKAYAPLRTASEAARGLGTARAASYVVHTQGDPVSLVSHVRNALAALDPAVALARPERYTDLVDRTNASAAMTMLLLVVAGSVSLLIGLIGVYAVISFGVSQRTGEIGVRLALGARPGDVARMILRQSSVVIAVGIAAGVAGALAGTRVLQSLLYGVASRDPLTFAAVAVGLFAVPMLASSLPAWRAARQNPLDSLRT